MPGGVISSATKVYYAHFYGKMIYNDKQEIIAVDEMCLFLSCYCTQVFCFSFTIFVSVIETLLWIKGIRASRFSIINLFRKECSKFFRFKL